jgi:dTDP-4-amino-4,6-dideoxygalactose transaminase
MTVGKGIPFLDLITPHVELQGELLDAVKGVLTSGMFVGGPLVEKFEREFAQFCDTKYCVAVNSGTDALRFALIAAEIGENDIVITVPNTFIATVEAIVQTRATAHFVDVDRQTSNMDVESLKAYLKKECERSATGLPVHRATGKIVKAIIPVHLYGQMCDMDALTAVADEYKLTVFEDACQAHGSEYFSATSNRWRKAGSIGKAGAFSFYPGKNLGACGEAGAVTTNDEVLAVRMRMIRDHGQNKKYHHLVEGYNGRIDAMQAAMLSVKLPFIDDWNASRRDAAQTYNTLLAGIAGLRTPSEPAWSRGNYHLYVVHLTRRDELQRLLTEKQIGTGLHYPIPCHLQKGYESLGYHEGDFPVAEKLATELLSLPMFPQLRKAQQEQVAEVIEEFSNVQTANTTVR